MAPSHDAALAAFVGAQENQRRRLRGERAAGGVCLCQEYECLSASYAKLLSVFMCAQREGSRGSEC